MGVASVKAGTEVSLEVTFDNPDLDVAARVFDDSGVSPVIVGGPIAMENYFGNSYRCKFIPEIGKTYVVSKAVYTDGFFVTLDDNYSQASESFQAIAGSVILGAAVQGQNLSTSLLGNPLSFTQGDTPILVLKAVDSDGDPVDITGATLTTYIKGPTGSNVIIPNSQHTITDGLNGEYEVALTSDDSEACQAGANKEVITKSVLLDNTIHYHGVGILTVLVPLPIE